VVVQIHSTAPKTNSMIYRGMEQLVARRAHNPKAAGSSPAPATRNLEAERLARSAFLMLFARCINDSTRNRLAGYNIPLQYAKGNTLSNGEIEIGAVSKMPAHAGRRWRTGIAAHCGILNS